MALKSGLWFLRFLSIYVLLSYNIVSQNPLILSLKLSDYWGPSLPRKYSVANAVGKLKGKSAILLNQKYVRRKNVMGFQFWARGYCVSTVVLRRSGDKGLHPHSGGARNQGEANEFRILTINLDVRQVLCPLIGGILKLPALRVVHDVCLA